MLQFPLVVELQKYPDEECRITLIHNAEKLKDTNDMKQEIMKD